LDDLLREIQSLSKQIESHQEILETENQNLKATELSIQAGETEYTEAVDKCEKERQQALDDFTQYTAELEELEQIANPAVRYSHVVNVTLPPPKEAVEVEDTGVALAQEAGDEFTGDLDESSLLMESSDVVWSRESCVAFLGYASRHAHHLGLRQDPNATLRMSCDRQRKKLQKVFSKAYNTLKDLEKDAKERSEDETCFSTANATKASMLVPLVAQRDAAVAKIEYSGEAIAALQPVLNMVNTRAEKMRAHIDSTLTPECQEASDVSKYLTLVRELILSLQECPGRGDFMLKIPEASEKEWYSMSRYKKVPKDAPCPATRQGLTFDEKLHQQYCRKLGGIVKLCGTKDRVQCSKVILYNTNFGTPESPELPCTACKRGLNVGEQTAQTRCQKAGGKVTLCGCFTVYCNVRVALGVIEAPGWRNPKSHHKIQTITMEKPS
jgi:hypothetical protein